MLPEDLTACLAERLRQPLPGRSVMARFAPDLSYGRHFDPPRRAARAAAVVVLLYQRDCDWRLPLVVRPMTMSAHAGQVALPGGLIEPGESCEEAALRELHEELGVPPAAVTPLGRLSPLWVMVSNFHVTPVVAIARTQPLFVLSSDEVAETIDLPALRLFDPACIGQHQRTEGGIKFTSPHWQFGSHRVWGATCMILGELASVLREISLS
jgi:8-oxo-dGTP pyrophosphatase MutT (NUDIX family)